MLVKSKRRMGGGLVLVIGLALPAPAISAQQGPRSEFTALIGGHLEETGQGLVVDDAGNIYIGGETNSPDFETTEGALREEYGGGVFDGFLTKLDPTGTEIIWSTFLGGQGWDAIHRQNGLALGPDGSLYVTGFTHSPDFPVKKAFDDKFDGPYEAFVARFSPEGELLFSTFIGGTDGVIDAAKGVVVDDEGAAYITGQMMSSDLPVVGGWPKKNPGFDGFLAKVSAEGKLVFSTYLGGSNGVFEDGQSLALGDDGLVYVTGITEATDFPTTRDAFQNTNPGGRSLFVTAIDVQEGELEWSTYLGGTKNEGALSLQATSIALDAQGYVYVAGSTESPDYPITTDLRTETGLFGSDVVVTKLLPDGSDIVYSTVVGGADTDVANTILIDNHQRAYVVGKTYSESLFPDPHKAMPRGGGSDGYVFFLSRSGEELEFSGYIGGSAKTDGTPAELALTAEESSITATLDRQGAIYITGIASTPDFRTTDGKSVSGAWDAYIMKIWSPHPAEGLPESP